MNKSIIQEIIKINKLIHDGKNDGSVTYQNYTSTVKPALDKFRTHQSVSPNLILKECLKKLSPHFQDGPFELKNFQNYGNNNLHEFVWATWFYRFPNVKGYPASSSPQLYILIHSNGLKFGLDYGNDVEEDNPLVTQVFSDNDLIQSIIAACKVVPSYSLVEGGPYLAQRSDEVRLSSADEVRKNWSNRVHLIKQFLLDEIPDNIEDIIDETLEKLVPLFKKLCNKEVTRFEEEEPVGLVEDYSKEDFYREVFFHESLLEDILEILNRKKNIVLQGAPGTGKSFISERIAYLYMGKKDKSRVRTIQFHQSYSYEDFIQGYRPTKEGGLELVPGIFFDFCEM